ncbi:hypothetical protein MMC21_007733 [Puttea exsequens]|nr:hypothetical protein [Puttea exsequens]
MPGCTGCRVRHLKCDRSKTCSPCQSAGRECIRGYNVRFRNLVCPNEHATAADYGTYEYFFDEDQSWVDEMAELKFVDETQDTTESYWQGTAIADDAHPSFASKHQSVRNRAPASSSILHESNNLYSSAKPLPGQCNRRHSPLRDEDYYYPASETATHMAVPTLNTINSTRQQSLPSASPSGVTPGSDSQHRPGDVESDMFTNTPHWSDGPLVDRMEFKLLQHFVTHLGPWFDVGDSRRHFTKLAPKMAARSPLLMNAILAIAALHLGRTSDYDVFEAVKYHDKCLGLMVPMLDEPDHLKKDDLLMTTVVLHLYEDMDDGNTSRRHLSATSIVLPSRGTCISSYLRRAVFWVHLRQEIYLACVEQCTIQANLDNCNVNLSDEADNDNYWFHRTLFISAQVLQWAFGGSPSKERWQELVHLLKEWDFNRPKDFDALFFNPIDPMTNRWTPEICYATDEHVCSAHFILLAKLFLTTHDPTIPRIGPRLKSATAKMKEYALSYVRTLTGIAICNSYVPARFTATLAITNCANWFEDRAEQGYLIDFIQVTEQVSAVPRRQAQRDLIDEWGWPEEDRMLFEVSRQSAI